MSSSRRDYMTHKAFTISSINSKNSASHSLSPLFFQQAFFISASAKEGKLEDCRLEKKGAHETVSVYRNRDYAMKTGLASRLVPLGDELCWTITVQVVPSSKMTNTNSKLYVQADRARTTRENSLQTRWQTREKYNVYILPALAFARELYRCGIA